MLPAQAKPTRARPGWRTLGALGHATEKALSLQHSEERLKLGLQFLGHFLSCSLNSPTAQKYIYHHVRVSNLERKCKSLFSFFF